MRRPVARVSSRRFHPGENWLRSSGQARQEPDLCTSVGATAAARAPCLTRHGRSSATVAPLPRRHVSREPLHGRLSAAARLLRGRCRRHRGAPIRCRQWTSPPHPAHSTHPCHWVRVRRNSRTQWSFRFRRRGISRSAAVVVRLVFAMSTPGECRRVTCRRSHRKTPRTQRDAPVRGGESFPHQIASVAAVTAWISAEPV